MKQLILFANGVMAAVAGYALYKLLGFEPTVCMAIAGIFGHLSAIVFKE